MRLLRAIRKQFHRSRNESDLDGELRGYVEMLADQKVRDGADPAAARRAALMELGGMEAVKDQVRDASALAWLDASWQDARYALRGLGKAPGFTAIALLSLALGIGANSAIFAVFYAVLVRPLPYHDAGRLLAVGRSAPGRSGTTVITPEFAAWRLDQHVFTGITSWNDAQFNLTGAASPERVTGATITDQFLQVLGVHAVLGRDLLTSDRNAAVITYELWQRQFGSDPAAVGRPILLNDKPVTLVGVLPPRFRFPGDIRAEILVADDLPRQPNFQVDTVGGLHGIGRLREGATAARAASDLAEISRRWEPQMSHWLHGSRTGSQVMAHSLQTELVGDTRPVLVALLGAVSLLLLLACVNVANLQLARAAVRRREIGLRAALGASRVRLARLLVIENLVLAVMAGAAGLFLAMALLKLLPASAGIALGEAVELQIGWQLAIVAFGFSTLAGLLVGLAPALLAPRLDFNDVLKSGALSLIGGRGVWVRSILVVGQVSLALVLLVGSGLLLRSLQSVLQVDPGFRADHVLTASFRLAGQRYKEDARKSAFLESLLARVQALPGVDAAAIVNSPPMGGYSIGAEVTPDNRGSEAWQKTGAPIIVATPGYLRVLGIRLLRGRALDDRDQPGSTDVALVSELFANRVFPGADPIGRSISWVGNRSTIVGVIGDVRHSGPEREANPEVVVSEWQHPQMVSNLLVRTRNDPMALASGIRPTIWAIDKNLPVANLRTMDDLVARAGSSRRVQTVLLTSFGFLALLLAAVGIYGVGAEAVAQRTREIGLRMALGARAPDVIRSVMARSLVLSAAGIAAGAAAGFFLVRYLKRLLYGVQPTDAVAFACAVLMLFAVASLAALIPARRAARIDPVAALRCD